MSPTSSSNENAGNAPQGGPAPDAAAAPAFGAAADPEIALVPRGIASAANGASTQKSGFFSRRSVLKSPKDALQPDVPPPPPPRVKKRRRRSTLSNLSAFATFLMFVALLGL